MYGLTGDFQAVDGQIFGKYWVCGWQDFIVESFAGTHDMLGGQIWGWYNELGNTSQKTKEQEVLSNITTVAALPISAPFAIADLMSSDFVEVLFKLGGN